VERRSLDAFFANSSSESEMEIVVLTHQSIFKKHHDLKLPCFRYAALSAGSMVGL
jgi:hypothetical protein